MKMLKRKSNESSEPKSAARLAVESAIATVIVLLIPFTAMFLTEEMQWDAADFIIMGLLIFGAVFGFRAMVRRGSMEYKIATAIWVLTSFLMIWINLAVGIVGSGPNLPNILYGAMVALGFLMAVGVNFRARGMMYTLFTMAGANVLLTLWGTFKQLSVTVDGPPVTFFLFNAFFIVLWSAAALMYRNGSLKLKV